MKKTVVASGSEAYMDPTGLHGTLIASRRLQQRRKKTRWNRSGGIMHLAIDTLRNDTPGCQHVLHFNNAGASLSPMPVVNALKHHIDLEARIGGYEAEAQAIAQTETCYTAAAQLLNCQRDEIAFIDNATRAWDMAFYSFKFKAGDRILTSVSEYASNYLAFLHMAKRTGVVIDVIANDPSGQLDIADLHHKIKPDVTLIAITHVPTQGGLINPAEDVGKLARHMGIPYILDATQSVGQMPVDVKKIGCDFLCATGRKFLRGPRGTGFLYARKDIISHYDPPFIDLHAAQWSADNEYILHPDARRFETWEQNIAAKIGLGVAIDYALVLGMPAIWARVQHLAALLRQQLAEVPSLQLHDLGIKKCGIVTFSSQKKSVQAIRQHLADKQINVSISRQEYARLDLVRRNLPAVIRASVHYYNTEEEIYTFCKEMDIFLNQR